MKFFFLLLAPQLVHWFCVFYSCWKMKGDVRPPFLLFAYFVVFVHFLFQLFGGGGLEAWYPPMITTQ